MEFVNNVTCISIHALRVEGDFLNFRLAVTLKISIHALRVEGDTPSLVSIKIFKGFLSTPSGWRATKTCHICIRIDQISIHALRVEGDCKLAAFLNKLLEISIHALRVEGDL